MKKDGDLVVFYGITYGKNGTISQIETFGYWTDINEGFADYTNDPYNEGKVYEYTVTDPLRGYDFGEYYTELTVTAYSSEAASGIALVKGEDNVYRSKSATYTAKPTKFTVSTQYNEADLVIYAEYVTTASESAEV